MSAPETSPNRLSFSPDWPASLAARTLRRAFLGRLFGFEPSESDAELREQITDFEGFGERRDKALQLFYRALIWPTGSSRVDHWLNFFGAELKPLYKQILEFSETREYLNLSPHERSGQLPVLNGACTATLLKLFSQLLGVAVLRPIIGDEDGYKNSPVYYATIDQKCLQDETKQLILESAVIPPGRGSVGACFRDGQRRLSISFADYVGVVEWQDLIQGQISMLLRKSYAETRTKLFFISALFFPVPYVFDQELPLGSLAQLDYGVEHNPKNVFEAALNECLGHQLVKDIVSEFTEYQDSYRRNRQFSNAIDSIKASETHKFAAAVVNLLIPASFTDLPIPLDAAAAIITENADPLKSKVSQIAHGKITRQALAKAVQNGACRQMTDFMRTWHIETPISPECPPLSGIAEKLAEQLTVSDKDVVFLPDEKNCEAIWWFHHKADESVKWPKQRDELARALHVPLTRILDITDKLVGWRIDQHNFSEEWQSTLPLFAEFKLRDNLASQYYSLASRVLFAGADVVERRLQEFKFLLTISTGCDALGILPDPAAIERACASLQELREKLQTLGKEQDNPFVGTTSFVIQRDRVICVEHNRENPHLRLWPMLRIQQRLACSSEATILTDCGAALKLAMTRGNTVQLIEEGRPIEAVLQDRFASTTDLNPATIPKLAHLLFPSENRPGSPEERMKELSDFFGRNFEILKGGGSSFKDGAPVDAALCVLFQEGSPPSVNETYKTKLSYLAELFTATMEEHYNLLREKTEAVKQKVRADTADKLVQGTSHSLKIPIQVATKYAKDEHAKKTEEVLNLARGFVGIGAYVQQYHKDKRTGKEKERYPLIWVLAPPKIADSFLVFDQQYVSDQLRMALDYVTLRSPENESYDAITILNRPDQFEQRIKVTFGDQKAFCLAQAGRLITRKNTTLSGTVFISAFLEVLANAIAYADPENPVIRVDIRVLPSEEAEYLTLTIENNGKVTWVDTGDFDEYLNLTHAVVGIQMARWASEALLWEGLRACKSELDGEPSQRVQFRAPFRKQV